MKLRSPNNEKGRAAIEGVRALAGLDLHKFACDIASVI
jgi:hypothetical protein